MELLLSKQKQHSRMARHPTVPHQYVPEGSSSLPRSCARSSAARLDALHYIEAQGQGQIYPHILNFLLYPLRLRRLTLSDFSAFPLIASADILHLQRSLASRSTFSTSTQHTYPQEIPPKPFICLHPRSFSPKFQHFTDTFRCHCSSWDENACSVVAICPLVVRREAPALSVCESR